MTCGQPNVVGTEQQSLCLPEDLYPTPPESLVFFGAPICSFFSLALWSHKPLSWFSLSFLRPFGFLFWSHYLLVSFVGGSGKEGEGPKSKRPSSQVRRPLEKNEIVYTVEDKAADGARIFTATVSAIDFRGGPYKAPTSASCVFFFLFLDPAVGEIGGQGGEGEGSQISPK